MSTLQVKNLPDDLHRLLVERARAEKITMSEWVTRTLRRELSRPSMSQWIEQARSDEGDIRDIDSVGAVNADRDERESGR